MMPATIRDRVARLRHPRRAARLALALWIVWAIVVWNVVLDHVIVVAAREYLYAAALADVGRGPHVTMDDFMRPAVRRGVSAGSVSALAIVAIGFAGVGVASRRPGPIPT